MKVTLMTRSILTIGWIYIFWDKMLVPNLCILWSRSSSWILQEFSSFSFPVVEYGWFVFNESFSLDWSRLALIWLRLIMDETAMKIWPRLWIIISAYILIKQCPTQAVRTVVATEYLLLSTYLRTDTGTGSQHRCLPKFHIR